MKNLGPYLIIGALALLFCGLSLLILSHGHLHEDAYILLQYVKNIAQGKGIVFDHVSGPAEGATDFLWMVLLAGCVRLGVDPAISSTLFNAIGLVAIAFVLYRIRGRFDVVTAVAMVMVAISGGTIASLLGFSTLIFGGIFSLVILSALQGRSRAMAWLGLLLALVRPEGVILSGGTILAQLLTVSSEERRRVVRALIPPCIVGVGYFLWRVSYFELVLPLPLLVKSQTTSFLEGLWFNRLAMGSYTPLLLPLIIAPIFAPKQTLQKRELLVLTLGPVALLFSLTFVHQSQNVGFRFQFPAVLSLVWLFVLCARGALQKPLAAIAIACLPIVWGTRLLLDADQFQTNHVYINSFPQLLRASGFKADRIAMTEAGRFPYWYDASMMIDLIGLNSPETLVDGPKMALERGDPELLFIHHAGTFRAPVAGIGDDFVIVDPQEILSQQASGPTTREQSAPIAALEFAKNRGYRAAFVRYGATDTELSHVYFISPTLNFELFLETLRRSMREKMSYFASRR